MLSFSLITPRILLSPPLYTVLPLPSVPVFFAPPLLLFLTLSISSLLLQTQT